jgi:histidinol dehydrogenase
MNASGPSRKASLPFRRTFDEGIYDENTTMLKILSPQEASETILKRDDWLQREVPASLKKSLRRIFGEALTPEQAVRRILADVRHEGDAALRSWSSRIDGVALQQFAVPQERITGAAETVAPKLLEALQLAAGRIRDFHSRQPLPDWTTTDMGGVMGQRVTPLRRVGAYVPGGTAPLPSSLLMSVIPAQVAGVEEVVVATPPGRDGGLSDVILAAAHVVGVDTIYMLGGAQAVAALAYGSESIPAVDKIVGPGNLFVTLAKQQVYGLVGIDGLYGPTETVVIADDSADAAWVAADLLAQAEHDVLATAILLTPSRRIAEAVQREIGAQLEQLSRSEIIAESLRHQGGIVLTEDLAQAARLANAFAAEHLCLDVAHPQDLADQIGSAGGFFFGGHSFEVLGDYVAGPSHTMPTSGTARFASPLNVFDFVRINSIVALDPQTSAELSRAAAIIAESELLTAHAAAARRRLEPEEDRT